MADLSIDMCGIKSPNPFWLASAPPANGGEQVMRAGDCAGFPGGVEDGHHLQNRGGAPARFLVVGGRDDRDGAEYPDIDLRALPEGYVHKDGAPYPR